jgi:hypothetical protein
MLRAMARPKAAMLAECLVLGPHAVKAPEHGFALFRRHARPFVLHAQQYLVVRDRRGHLH